MKKIILFILVIILTFSFTACANNDGGEEEEVYEKQFNYTINDGKPVKLLVDLNNLMPTSNTVATPQQPKVFRSIQTIANRFMVEFPNVEIVWAYSKISVGNWEQWMTTQIQTNDAPDIVFMHGAKYADRNWFMNLNDILNEPNVFISEGEKGNEKWKDMFPNYMWDSAMTTDPKGNILAVPATIYPGTATAYFYNKDIFNELKLEIPHTWEEFKNVSLAVKKAGYTAVAPWSLNSTANVDVWDIQYSLGPTYAYDIKEQWDYDGNGKMSEMEKMRATYEGVFYGNGINRDRMLSLYDEVGYKYNQILDKGAGKTNYEPLWNQGKVAMMEDGMWRLGGENANTEREFEYGIFPTPLVDSATTEFASDFELGDGAYNPPIAESFNICKQASEQKGAGNLEASIKFLQWITMPEHMNMMVMEKQGELLSAVRGTKIPSAILPFIQGKFPRTPNCTWTTGVTVATQEVMSRQLQYYIAGRKTADEFILQYDKNLHDGLLTMIKALDIKPNELGWGADAYKG